MTSDLKGKIESIKEMLSNDLNPLEEAPKETIQDTENATTANWTSFQKDTLKEHLSSLQEIIEKGNIYRKEPKILITSVDDNDSVLNVPKGSTSSAPDPVSICLGNWYILDLAAAFSFK